MIKDGVLVFVCLVVGFVLTIGVYLLIYSRSKPGLQIPSLQTQFSLEKAPKNSVLGMITSYSGNVLWQSRISTAPPLTIFSSQKIQQGEGIMTGGNGTFIIQFDSILTISGTTNTAVNIIQTLPANFVFQQKEGMITYKKIDTTTPVSVRAFDLLITMVTGTCSLFADKDKSQVRVSVNSGSIDSAFTDSENTTTMLHVGEGHVLIFDNNTKKVTTI